MRKLVVCIVVSVLCLFMLMNCFADENEIGILTQLSVSEDELNENIQESFFKAIPFSGFRFFDSFNSLVTALEAGTIGAIETLPGTFPKVFPNMRWITACCSGKMRQNFAALFPGRFRRWKKTGLWTT